LDFAAASLIVIFVESKSKDFNFSYIERISDDCSRENSFLRPAFVYIKFGDLIIFNHCRAEIP